MIKIHPIPAFDDNYIWCVYDGESRQALVVDPGDSKPVIDFIASNNLNLKYVLITHHHFDHVGGLEALSARYAPIVYGPQTTDNPFFNHKLADSNTLTVLNIDFTVIDVPGHTLDHIAYYTDQLIDKPAVFCGDTLFAGGCGRIFEGTPAMMHKSLSALAKLPSNTKVYCAHEYTLANLGFAQAVEPDNQALLERIEHDKHLRRKGIPTVPSNIGLELATNPFLRSQSDAIVIAAANYKGQTPANEVEVFSAIREWKDNF